MNFINDKESLPPLERTLELTEYSGTLPVIIFSLEERREYFGWPEIGWPGLLASKETARSHFKADPKCHHIAVLMMNEPGAATEASYEGAYRRSDFEKGGIYEDAPQAGITIILSENSSPGTSLHREPCDDPKPPGTTAGPGLNVFRPEQSLSDLGGHELLKQMLGRVHRSGLRPSRTRSTIDPDYEHPYKSFPPAHEMKVATISEIIGTQEGEAAEVGMYLLVPPYFPNECKVFQGTVGHYVRFKNEAGVADNFFVRPAPTIARANELYEELRNSTPMPDFLISVRHTPAAAGKLHEEHFTSPPDETVTCCCGKQTTLRYINVLGRYWPEDPAWIKRKSDDRDIHLPISWYCGGPGHYLASAETHEAAGSRRGHVEEFFKTLGED